MIGGILDLSCDDWVEIGTAIVKTQAGELRIVWRRVSGMGAEWTVSPASPSMSPGRPK